MLAGTHELTRADAFLAALLDTPTVTAIIGEGRRYAHLAPPILDDAPAGAGDRHVVWTLTTPADDVRTAGAAEGRLIVGALYAVKAVGTVDAPADLEPLADAIDLAVEGAHAVGAGLRAVIARRSPLLYPELPAPGAQIIWHVGALYAVELTTA